MNSFCARCGAAVAPADRFCPRCGNPLRVTEGFQRPAYAESVGIRNRLGLSRVCALTFISYGLYLYYWFYLTWKQYRDRTGEQAYPVWHALTLLVPIYGLFRTHAHMRTYRGLMISVGIATTISAGWAVTAVIISSAVDWNSVQFGSDQTRGLSVAAACLDIFSMLIVAWMIVHVQGNLNRYWDRISPGGAALDARLGVGEVVFSLLGVIIWAVTLADLFGGG